MNSKYAQSGRRYRDYTLRLAIPAALCLAPPLLYANAITDGTMGAVQSLSGNFTVPQTLGTIRGGNLFHSFQNFSVNGGESATFTTTSGTLQNVIARVTGGTGSSIDGPLRLQAAAGTPAFYFINPAGVTFGAGASIDVPGTFHVGTADYLKLADGSRLYADLGRQSTLSAAPPEAFGFLGGGRAAIAVKDGAILVTAPRAGASLVAGDIEIDNAALAAPGGSVLATAVGAVATEVDLTARTGSDTAAPTTAFGRIDLRNGGKIAALGGNGIDAGGVTLIAGDIAIDSLSGGEAGVFSQTLAGGGDAGDLVVRAAGKLTLQNGGQLSATTASAGRAANVLVEAGSIAIDGNGVGKDVNGDGIGSGIFSMTVGAGTGAAGAVTLRAAGDVSLARGGQIVSATFSGGRAGAVDIAADSLAIDGGGILAANTGVFGVAGSGSTGDAGSIDLRIHGNLAVTDAGWISSSTYSSGKGGSVRVAAGSLLLDGRGVGALIQSNANPGSSNDAGSVEVSVSGTVTLANGGQIASGTFTSGHAGSVELSAGSVTVDGQGNTLLGTGIYSTAEAGSLGDAGNVDVQVTRDLAVVDGGVITSSTNSVGKGGAVKIAAGSLLLDGRGVGALIQSNANPGSSNDAGSVEVSVSGAATLANGGQIASGTFSGRAGTVKLTAGSVTVDGQGNPLLGTGIYSTAEAGSLGDAGNVDVQVTRNLAVVDGGGITSSTNSVGKGGAVKIAAGSLLLDGRGVGAAIYSNANSGSSNDAGSVEVSVSGAVTLANGGQIASSTFSSGRAGTVKLIADSIVLDGQGNTILGTGIYSTAEAGSLGDAGNVEVGATGNIAVVNAAGITSSTRSSGRGGAVKVTAGSVVVDGGGVGAGIQSNASLGSSNDAGSVEVAASGTVTIANGGQIASGTFTSGRAGTVKLTADSITIDGQGIAIGTGIYSTAEVGSSGDAGNIDVRAVNTLAMAGGGQISTHTSGAGRAGVVTVAADIVQVAGELTLIGSGASAGSSGQTGNVAVNAGRGVVLFDYGSLSIQNDATVANPDGLAPTLLSVAAPRIGLFDGGNINASSTGNVAASNIRLDFGERLMNSQGAITTSAVSGNGGGITIAGSGLLALDHAQITTSVTGATNGNGGDIGITAPILLLNTGFIQANTAAAAASGGNVNIDIHSIIASGNRLFVAGAPLAFDANRFGYNAIQAAAPDGVNGVIRISSPQVDLSGSLAGLSTQFFDFGKLGMDLCRIGAESSLTPVGRGGLPPLSTDLLQP